MPWNEKARTVKIAGLITPSEWDEDDNIIGVTLATADEEEYRIETNEKSKELFEYIYHDVLITGSVEEDEFGDRILLVKDYEVLGEEAYEEELDYDDEDIYKDDSDDGYDDESYN